MTTKTPIFKTLAIIGVGMMGASVAQAARRAGVAQTFVGFDKDPKHCKQALHNGVVDKIYDSIAETVAHADMVMIASPMGTYQEIAESLQGALKPDCILTDLGSVKAKVYTRLLQSGHPPELIIPGHPIAGSEKSGPTHGITQLFQDRYVIITPKEHTDKTALQTVIDFWQLLGADVEIMTPEHHDRVLAITSHLPHLLSYAMVDTASNLEDHLKRGGAEHTLDTSEVIKYSAGGFRDSTRLAGSDPIMWRDIFLENEASVLEMLERFIEDLTAIKKSIRYKDGEHLQSLFEKTREIRKDVIEQGQAGTFVPTNTTHSDDDGTLNMYGSD